ncbi:uncharacterized protein LOC120084183 [Benincasa hispida]|uniref:uncharacterized protein LOC120084183 n=1 Tax=Benincasa hispida TaxID=102211 RepID=UPI0019008345|nr:uncharacterized protein LOC120084183 [Benincasa hispida]
MPVGLSPYVLVFGKACYLPLELEHKMYWVVKKLNIDLEVAEENQKLQLKELDEWRFNAYENTNIYKENTKRWHDQCIGKKEFFIGQKMLLFNLRLQLFLGKLKYRCSRPFVIKAIFPYRAVELTREDDTNTFKVNGQRIKTYIKGNVECDKTSIELCEPA